jgi:hypothetical protein
MVDLLDRWLQDFAAVYRLIGLIVAPIVLCQRALKENPKHNQTRLWIILSLIAIILWISIVTIACTGGD